jgi:hypothetical protein
MKFFLVGYHTTRWPYKIYLGRILQLPHFNFQLACSHDELVLAPHWRHLRLTLPL